MIKWCIGVWSEQDTEYIAMGGDGTLYWTDILSEALLIDNPKGIIPPICVWLPVFVPNLTVSR
jgi:hypothetical protein